MLKPVALLLSLTAAVALSADPALPMRWMVIGNSIVLGNIEGGPSEDGWRRAAVEYWQSKGLDWCFAGGNPVCYSNHAGANGEDSAQIAGRFERELKERFPHPSAQCGVIIGTASVCNDPYWGHVTPDMTRKNLLGMAATTHAWCADMPVVFSADISSNDPKAQPNGNSDNVLPYRQAMLDAFHAAQAKGWKVYYIDPGYKNPAIAMAPSLVHPAKEGYDALGRIIAEKMYGLLVEDAENLPQPASNPWNGWKVAVACLVSALTGAGIALGVKRWACGRGPQDALVPLRGGVKMTKNASKARQSVQTAAKRKKR